MIAYLKTIAQIVYWAPEIAKTMVAHHQGRWFVFRDSPVAFLNFLAAIHGESVESASEGIRSYLQHAQQELKSRRKVGEA